jgi:hypothetical protein
MRLVRGGNPGRVTKWLRKITVGQEFSTFSGIIYTGAVLVAATTLTVGVGLIRSR